MFTKAIDQDITIRLLRESDAEELFDLVDTNREYLRNWLPWVDTTQTPDDSKQVIADFRTSWAEQTGAFIGIWYQSKLVGATGFNHISLDHRQAQIGYWLDEKSQNKGTMTKVCHALIDYAFEELALQRIEIRTATHNDRSQAIPKRLGFTHEGTLRQAERLYDKFVDLEVYSILSSEWQK